MSDHSPRLARSSSSSSSSSSSGHGAPLLDQHASTTAHTGAVVDKVTDAAGNAEDDDGSSHVRNQANQPTTATTTTTTTASSRSRARTTSSATRAEQGDSAALATADDAAAVEEGVVVVRVEGEVGLQQTAPVSTATPTPPATATTAAAAGAQGAKARPLSVSFTLTREQKREYAEQHAAQQNAISAENQSNDRLGLRTDSVSAGFVGAHRHESIGRRLSVGVASFKGRIRSMIGSPHSPQGKQQARIAQLLRAALSVWETTNSTSEISNAWKEALAELKEFAKQYDPVSRGPLVEHVQTCSRVIIERTREGQFGHPQFGIEIHALTSMVATLAAVTPRPRIDTSEHANSAASTAAQASTSPSHPEAIPMSKLTPTRGIMKKPKPSREQEDVDRKDLLEAQQIGQSLNASLRDLEQPLESHVSINLPDSAEITAANMPLFIPDASRQSGATWSVLMQRDEVLSFSEAFSAALPPRVNTKVSCDDLRFTVQVKNPDAKQPRAPPTIRKEILKGVSVIVEAGTVLAIMGPSGCGKTTLLDILAGRKTRGDIRGQVLINDKPRESFGRFFTRMSGYVTQDDVLPETLTVRESLWYTAQLRLPQSLANVRKNARVDEIIRLLTLGGCKDSRIGGKLLRGISGGERRRLSIGTELLTSPSILFLDEPTSGLSATDALNVMETIMGLAKQGRAVLTTIHQPRSNIFHMFDQLLLMSQGSPVYYGSASSVGRYFAQQGYECPAGFNIADFILDVVTVRPPLSGQAAHVATPDPSTASTRLSTVSASTDASGLTYSSSQSADKSGAPTDESVQALVNSFMSSAQYAATRQALQSTRKAADTAVDSNAEVKAITTTYGATYATSFLVQFALLSRRMFFTTLRNPFMFAAGLIINIVFGVITGSIWASLNQDKERSIVMALYYIPVFLGVESFLVAPLLVEERHLFLRERAAGAYRTSAYLAARVVNETPQYALSGLVFAIICYFMIGFQQDLLYYCVVIVIFINVGISFVSLVGAAASTAEGANMGAASYNTFAMLFAGCFQTLPNLPNYWTWAYYASYMSAGFSGLVKAEFTDAVAPPIVNGTLSTDGLTQQEVNYVILQTYDLVIANPWDNVYILLGWWAGFRILTYFALRFLNKEQR
ncbi:breast cancer resistance protein [Capsaspora owczarzaki ATCC 30864]|uniref:Breast cancer resistance protein n=1 Tax=Capsaspora owczarzaki (strain ATCC 30864) TaxID=595528 RepID=A0A0D2X1D8_CAPO3|nr:breast cancer resistance protein [Capsaspora owczarzaki ATCC 30864]KJE90634.1 breast cancer resistance protein [Capsaspora owczarzaki ATCC 30864]|eukprot:XP_004364784.1 breast cancer resistance protein [Capsaspora owczarzaki ATCC 30864]